MMDAGSLLTAWNPASHTAYDTDDDLATIAAEHLGELLDALGGIESDDDRHLSDRV